MNIFILDKNIRLSARYHADKHIVKMPLETAQMLCTALREVVGDEGSFEGQYKSTHKNHPCNKWARNSYGNFIYLCNLGVELCNEYEYRYGKKHKCFDVIIGCFFNANKFKHKFHNTKRTPFAQAMPVAYKRRSAIEAYRFYYLNEKQHLLTWKSRPTPKFVIDYELKTMKHN